MGKQWIQLTTSVSFGFWIFDFVTDILNVIAYWKEQSTTIATLATVSMGWSVVAGVPIVIVAIAGIFTGKKKWEKLFITLECIETVVESIPQLLINLYILSSCRQHIPVIQYISLIGSFLDVCFGIFSFENISFGKEDENVNEGHANKLIYWLEKAVFFFTKGLALTSRILILVYFIFKLGWYTMVFVGVHSAILLVPCITWIFKTDRSCKEGVLIMLIIVTWFQFVWAFDAFAGKWSTPIFSVFYSIENFILLTISLNVNIQPDPFCLYDNALWLNMELNFGCLIFAVIFTCIQRRS